MSKGIKIAVSGKGGVGKTTLSSLLCHVLARANKKVLAVDADPDANLGMALGFTEESINNAVTIAQDRKLIKERTGAEPGMSGNWFTLNPTVDDIPKRYIVEEHGIKLLQMGAVASGGGGCACPESTLLKALLSHLIIEEQDAVIVDMEAGLEHLGRGTAGSVDALIIVMEQGQRSFATARNIVKLAADLGVTRIYGVVNKVGDVTESELQAQLGDEIELVGVIPYTPDAVACDYANQNVAEACPQLFDRAEDILQKITKK